MVPAGGKAPVVSLYQTLRELDCSSCRRLRDAECPTLVVHVSQLSIRACNKACGEGSTMTTTLTQQGGMTEYTRSRATHRLAEAVGQTVVASERVIDR